MGPIQHLLLNSIKMQKVTNKEWKLILDQKPSKEELFNVIRFTNKKDEAWRKLLKKAIRQMMNCSK